MGARQTGWPQGVKHPRVAAKLHGDRGEVIATLIARLVEWTATESINGRAVVAIDGESRLIVEPDDKTQVEWIRIRYPQWVVGTYSSLVDPEQLEGDLCERLAEVNGRTS